MRDTTRAKLDDILREVLALPPGSDVTALAQGDLAGWDSLAHTLLVGAIESEFGIEVDVADSLDLTSYAALARYLEAREL